MSNEQEIADLVATYQVCMFGSAVSHCGKPAKWHVRATELDGFDHCSFGCHEHLCWWMEQKTKSFDMHPVGHACGLPGAIWCWSQAEVGDGHCEFDWSDSDGLLADVPAPSLTA